MILDVRKLGLEYRVLAGQVSLRFRALTPHHDGPTAILEVLDLAIGGKPHVDRINLLSSRIRSSLASTLAKRWPEHPWAEILDDACFEVHQRMTEGEPPVALVPEAPTPDAWLIDGLVPLDEITVLYADGGSLKSWFALALAVAARRNEPLAPSAKWCVRQCVSVLYLDWETDQRTHARRLWRLYQGLGIQPVDGISYLGLKGQPLHSALSSLSSSVAKLGADLIIVDSLGMACGDEPETALANLRTLGALSTLPGTKLVLAHVNAQTATSPNGVGRPYGSVFIRNTARSAIEARSEPEDHGALVTYYHRKANDGPLLRPSAIRYRFNMGGSVVLGSAEPDLQHAPVGDQILAELRGVTQGMTGIELAEATGATSATVRQALRRLGSKVVQLDPGARGRGQSSRWGLASHRQEEPGWITS